MIYGCTSKPLDSQRLAADFSSDLALISAGKNLLVTLDVFGYIRCIKKTTSYIPSPAYGPRTTASNDERKSPQDRTIP